MLLAWPEGPLNPIWSARGLDAPEACLHTFRFPLSEFHLSEFNLWGRLSSDELSSNLDVSWAQKSSVPNLAEALFSCHLLDLVFIDL